MPPPLERKVDNGARGLDGIQGIEGALQDGGMLGRFERLAQGVAEGPAHKDGTGRLDLFRIVPHDGYADGGDTSLFDGSLNQSHGLIADPSARNEQHGIHLI